jgi:hypothetical protein
MTNTLRIVRRDRLSRIYKPVMMVLPAPSIIRQQESQPALRQHLLVYRYALMGQWVDLADLGRECRVKKMTVGQALTFNEHTNFIGIAKKIQPDRLAPSVSFCYFGMRRQLFVGQFLQLGHPHRGRLRLPVSHRLSVTNETPSKSANCCWVSPVVCRKDRIWFGFMVGEYLLVSKEYHRAFACQYALYSVFYVD